PPFPNLFFFFADEMDDGGAYLRGITADFVQRYNPRMYSPPQYAAWILAPVVLHQGTADDAVPLQWSNTFADKMEYLNKDITYYIYQDEDHNFTQGSWTTLIQRDLQFFRKNLNL
ncbi:MAG: Prolyl oligopeptidase family protein, partial [Microgenomates bacterium OLB23]